MTSLNESIKSVMEAGKKKAEEICGGCGEPMSKCTCDTVKEELKGKQKKLDKNHNGKLDKQDFEILRKEETEPPFDKPYKTTKATVTDKSGAKHGPMSRARDLARSALNKHLNATYNEYNPDKDKLKPQHFGTQVKEEVEQIEEISKATIGSYIKKATTDSTISRKIATDFEHRAKNSRKQDMKDANTSVANQFKDKSWKRQDNINKAVDRLTKEEVELHEANHREFASQGKMHPDMAKHMNVGDHMDYYEPKTGDKVHGKVMKNDGKEVHVKQSHDSYDSKKVGTVHKFTVSNKLDESEQKATPTVKTDKYSWGTMKTIHHGSSFSIPLHPEHHEHIAKMKDQQVHTIKTEDGRQYHVKREGDTVHFHGVNGGNKTSVPHKSLAEETQVDEAWVLRQKKKDKKQVKEENMLTFKDFITEMEFDKNGKYVHKGKYGTSYDDPEGKEDKEKPAAEKAEKRGRGRPAGAKSGARQIGGASKKGSGVEYTGYKLHLPNSNK